MPMDIGFMRQEYSRDGFSRSELSKDPFIQFSNWLKDSIDADIYEPNAMVLSTVNDSGFPDSRIVLLKFMDEQGLVFYTNYQSNKALDMSKNPNVSVLFPWHMLGRQVVIKGEVAPISKDESAAYFASRPIGSQLSAWASKQSRAVSSRQDLDNQFETIKAKFQDKNIPCPDFWGGYRIKPRSFKFWQGRENRLHDCFLYNLMDSKQWALNRVSP